jgi:ubiquinone/menaquinone biosynthesis C-methylase UbiE
MTRLSREIQEHYLLGLERDRLSSNEGELERLRTRAILARYLPPPPAVILDVGGGAGVHAFPLTEIRYNVHLIDPVELHLAQARSQSEKTGTKLASITLGNGCCLAVAAGVIDAVLLLGPLYHLVERTERLGALREAYRVVKPGGVLFAAAVSRFASLIDGLSRGHFTDQEFRDIVAADLATGQHRNPTKNPTYFTTAYFHRPEELADEVRESGFKHARMIAIEGPAWSAAHFRDAWADSGERKQLMQFLSVIEAEPSIAGSSAHFVAVAYR